MSTPTVQPDPEDSCTHRLASEAGASGVHAERSEGSGVEGHAWEPNGARPGDGRHDRSGTAAATEEGSAAFHEAVSKVQPNSPVLVSYRAAGINSGLPSLVSTCSGPTGPCLLEIGHAGDHKRTR